MRYLVKLVRDNVGKLTEVGRVVSYEYIDEDDVATELRKKLFEEVAEYMINPSVGELADIREVLKALAKYDLESSWAEVVNEGRRKYDERGGFGLGMGMYCE